MNRLKSLDILRGLTVAGMILVNNPGSWSNIYEPLEHASWNGLTPTDLVFPFFMFIMGVSTYFSLRRYDFKPSWPAIAKILRRTIVILLIGWGIAWFGRSLRGLQNPDVSFLDAVWNFSTMRALGVLPRLALCYGATALLALFFNRKGLTWIVGCMLVAYAVILVFGHGFEFSERNVISIVDHKVFGPEHMYADTIDGVRLKFDPEGLLSTLPSIAHCLIGFLCGGMIVRVKDNQTRAFNLFILGAILTMCGFLLSYALPINKKVWSPTFVLTTCGLASSLLALLIWIIDIKGKDKWCTFFEVFGVNPLFLYALSSVLAILFGSLHFPCASEPDGFVTIHGLLYGKLLIGAFGADKFASLLYALIFEGINWLAGLPLYKKKIYIKI